MSNALTTLQNLKTGLSNVSASLPALGGTPILRVDQKSRSFVYGPDSEDVNEDDLWVVDVRNIQHGWVCWGDGELFSEVFVPFTMPKPQRADLKDYGRDAKWSECVSIDLKCADGDAEGVQVVYKPNSVGGLGAIRKLIDAVMVRVGEIPDGSGDYFPVVRLRTQDYAHKKWGTVTNPIIEVVAWADVNGEFELPDDAEDAPVAVDRKIAKATREPDPVREPDPEPDEPVRRRRRA